MSRNGLNGGRHCTDCQSKRLGIFNGEADDPLGGGHQWGVLWFLKRLLCILSGIFFPVPNCKHRAQFFGSRKTFFSKREMIGKTIGGKTLSRDV